MSLTREYVTGALRAHAHEYAATVQECFDGTNMRLSHPDSQGVVRVERAWDLSKRPGIVPEQNRALAKLALWIPGNTTDRVPSGLLTGLEVRARVSRDKIRALTLQLGNVADGQILDLHSTLEERIEREVIGYEKPVVDNAKDMLAGEPAIDSQAKLDLHLLRIIQTLKWAKSPEFPGGAPFHLGSIVQRNPHNSHR